MGLKMCLWQQCSVVSDHHTMISFLAKKPIGVVPLHRTNVLKDYGHFLKATALAGGVVFQGHVRVWIVLWKCCFFTFFSLILRSQLGRTGRNYRKIPAYYDWELRIERYRVYILEAPQWWHQMGTRNIKCSKYIVLTLKEVY